jgi:membrane protein DedA with SNARE-associated domain
MTPVIAGLTGSVTTAIANHAVIAVFALMALDALLPVGGELVMLYAGVIAAGAVSGHEATLLGATLSPGFETYLVLALVGSIGYLVGSLVGWLIGMRGGRELVERRGRWLHLGPERFARAEAWFARWGSYAVFLGRITPLVRSFISITAGVLRSPLGPYTVLTLLGSLIWCFAFAGAGWALGDNWQTVHDNFRYVDYAVVVLVVLAAGVLVARARATRRA